MKNSCGVPFFEHEDEDNKAQAELLYRRYLAASDGAKIQCILLLFAIFLMLFSARAARNVRVSRRLTDVKNQAGQVMQQQCTCTELLNASQQLLINSTLGGEVADLGQNSLVVTSIAGCVMCCLLAFVWGNHVFAVAQSVWRHSMLQYCTATGLGMVSALFLVLTVQHKKNETLYVSLPSIFFLGCMGTSTMLIFVTRASMQFKPSALMCAIIVGSWCITMPSLETGDSAAALLHVVGSVVLALFILFIARESDTQARTAFLMNGVGGVFLNRFLLPSKPMHQGRTAYITSAADIWTAQDDVALKMTQEHNAYYNALEKMFWPGLDDEFIIRITEVLPVVEVLESKSKEFYFGSKRNNKSALVEDGPFLLRVPLYVSMMPRGECNLAQLMATSEMELHFIKSKAKEIARAVSLLLYHSMHICDNDEWTMSVPNYDRNRSART